MFFMKLPYNLQVKIPSVNTSEVFYCGTFWNYKFLKWESSLLAIMCFNAKSLGVPKLQKTTKTNANQRKPIKTTFLPNIWYEKHFFVLFLKITIKDLLLSKIKEKK